ncbi:MAG: SMC-Scp complex subunit ScpB [Gammaproteobacteria bacterium]|nr:SMC-Scp complex subunit ScpB [Gammaproteobacteria bacterium]MDH3413319.1 SMC-Scp complex subunit ScpB [Gammaproteobacteria bacterium]
MSAGNLKHIIEAALLAAGRPLRVDDILQLFEGTGDAPEISELRDALAQLSQDWNGRALELVEVSNGFRLQVRKEFSIWMGRLWAERPPKYSRALMETLALIAYRQPISRGEIEDVRGVSVSPNIIRTLLEREWIRVVGHRDVPGRPELFGTTKLFLDDFGLKALDEMPTLAEIRDLDRTMEDLFSDVSGPAPVALAVDASTSAEMPGIGALKTDDTDGEVEDEVEQESVSKAEEASD